MTTPSESVTRPMTDACSPCDARMSTAFCASSASSAMTMPMPMLKMLNISRWAIFPYFSRKRNTGRISHVPSSMAMPCPSCKMRGMFSSNPPPVMWLMPWTSHRRITSSTGFT